MEGIILPAPPVLIKLELIPRTTYIRWEGKSCLFLFQSQWDGRGVLLFLVLIKLVHPRRTTYIRREGQQAANMPAVAVSIAAASTVADTTEQKWQEASIIVFPILLSHSFSM
jgi:hypothetical protein